MESKGKGQPPPHYLLTTYCKPERLVSSQTLNLLPTMPWKIGISDLATQLENILLAGRARSARRSSSYSLFHVLRSSPTRVVPHARPLHAHSQGRHARARHGLT